MAEKQVKIVSHRGPNALIGAKEPRPISPVGGGRASSLIAFTEGMIR